MSSLNVVGFLNKLSDLGKFKDLKEIKKAELNGQIVEFEEAQVDLKPDRIEIEIKLKLAGGASRKVVGIRRWNPIGPDPDDITVDGRDVEPDEIHIELHRGLKVQVEYTLVWEDAGEEHTLSLRSKKISLLSLIT